MTQPEQIPLSSQKAKTRPATAVPILDRWLAIGAAARSGELSAGDISAFWVIADKVNSINGLSWPSLKTIATKAGISERAASRAVKDLRQKGYVSVAEKGTRTRSTRYRLTLKGAAGVKFEAASGTDRTVNTSEKGVLTEKTLCTDKPVRDVLTELSVHPSYDPAHKAGEEGGDAGFGPGVGAPALAASAAASGHCAHVRFWKAYPKKERAVSAERELDSHLAAGVDLEAIIRGAEDYRRLCEHQHRERTYIAAPLNWLKERRWEEDHSIPLPKQPKASKQPKGAKQTSAPSKKISKSRQKQETHTEREARLANRRQKMAERREQARKDCEAAQAKREEETRVARERYAHISELFEAAGLDIQKCGSEVFHHARRQGGFTHIKSLAEVQGCAIRFESAFKGESRELRESDAFVNIFAHKHVVRWCQAFIRHRTFQGLSPTAGFGSKAALYEKLSAPGPRGASPLSLPQQGAGADPGSSFDPG